MTLLNLKARIHTGFQLLYFNKNTFQVEIWNMVWTRFVQYPLQHGNWPWWNNPTICKASSEENGTGQYPVWMTQNYWKGDFRELKSPKNVGSMPPDPLRSLRLRRSFRKSVTIYPGSASNLTDSVDMIGCYFGAPCDNTQYSVFY